MKNSTSSEPGFVLSPILEKETITLLKGFSGPIRIP